jgi:BlaI family transcriptional regulator, penicillinase repressor
MDAAQPSDTELALLKLFWRHGAMSAREAQEHAEPELGWAVSTTRTTLERMRAKGLLHRRSVHGMAVYAPAQPKVSVIGAMLGRLSQMLDIKGALPASAFSGSELLSPQEVAELEALLAREPEAQ